MSKSLLFIPDISGYTKFIQTTEINHSQHVISELLEVLVSANILNLKLVEIEGDALFFYKEGDVPSQENLLAQIEGMFTAFHSHLELLKKNRICPCNACATAPDLELKIVAHIGDLQHIQVQGNRKPFGKHVIQAHRLLKNSVDSQNYALVSKALASEIGLPIYYYSKLFRFREGADTYDDEEIPYIFAVIDQEKLNLKGFVEPKKVGFDFPPQLILKERFEVSAETLLEAITNYTTRHHWADNVDKFEYNENEVTRIGTEHICVINGKHLNFTAISKDVEPGKLVYGELATSHPIFDEFNNFFVITPLSGTSCALETELYWKVKSPLKRIMLFLFLKKKIEKTFMRNLKQLKHFVETEGV
ncbi:DUF2652 domain-containing protein [Spongiimicrobium salis]|uniref:DUF2652 domain-containing protein n=1 Tax=Spongiimicrobium salis TaxID=1667022 RepID=UPI00374CC5B0